MFQTIFRRTIMSPPVRRRGLKRVVEQNGEPWLVVASRAEAWIETRTALLGMCIPGQSPPVRRRGLKREHGPYGSLRQNGRLPCGGVD